MAWKQTSLACCLGLLAAFATPLHAEAGGRDGLMRAVAALEAHRYGRAEKILEGVVAAFPDSLEAGFYLGQALYYQGRLDEAKQRFEAVRVADPGIPVTYYYLGRIAFDRGDFAGALGQLESADQRDPDLAMVHYYLGLAYDRRQRPGEALAEFRKALALQADLEPASYAMAYVLFHEFREGPEALACLRPLARTRDGAMRRKAAALRRNILALRGIQ